MPGRLLDEAGRRGLGVIAKRSLANAPWRFREPPEAIDVREYWERFHALGVDPAGLSWPELALRFAAFAAGVHACPVGTRRLGHLIELVQALSPGALPAELADAVTGAFRARGATGRAQV